MNKQQTIFRINKDPENPYVMMDKRPIENPELSWEAKGMLAYLLSRPNDWTINIYDLIKRSTAGEYAVRRIVKELIKAGHLTQKTERGPGGIYKQFVYEVYEQPFRDNPQVGNPHVDNRAVNNNDLSNINGEKRFAIPADSIPDQSPEKANDNLPKEPIQKIDPKSALLPETEGGKKLIQALAAEQKAKGRGATKYFESLIQKQKLEEAELRLGPDEFGKAMLKGLQEGVTKRASLVAWICKWNPQWVYKTPGSNNSQPQSNPLGL